VHAGQVRFITRPKYRTARATRQHSTVSHPQVSSRSSLIPLPEPSYARTFNKLKVSQCHISPCISLRADHNRRGRPRRMCRSAAAGLITLGGPPRARKSLATMNPTEACYFAAQEQPKTAQHTTHVLRRGRAPNRAVSTKLSRAQPLVPLGSCGGATHLTSG
jgi:hypothetical protein